MELVLAEVLKFLPDDERLEASRINQQWYCAGCSVSVWAHDIALAAGYDVQWSLPSPRIAACMVACSKKEPLCAAVRELRCTLTSDPSAASSPSLLSTAMESALFGMANLHAFKNSDGAMAERQALAIKSFMMQRYFPTLLWVLLCAQVPQALHIRKARSDNAEDEAPIGLWDLCFTFLAAPELCSGIFSSDLEILSVSLAAFHFFRITSVAVGLLLQKSKVFDAPLFFFLSSLSAVRRRHSETEHTNRDSVQTERSVVRHLLDESLRTISCMHRACVDALPFVGSDEPAYQQLRRLCDHLLRLQTRVESESRSWS